MGPQDGAPAGYVENEFDAPVAAGLMGALQQQIDAVRACGHGYDILEPDENK